LNTNKFLLVIALYRLCYYVNTPYLLIYLILNDTIINPLLGNLLKSNMFKVTAMSITAIQANSVSCLSNCSINGFLAFTMLFRVPLK